MRRDLPLLSDSNARKIIEELCAEHLITIDLIERLLEIQRDNLGRGRQIGISQEFSAAVSEFIEEREERENASS